VHGGQQEWGINYWETYAPVVTWAAIRLVLILTLIYGWYTTQIDFVLAYPQADVECDIYMHIPNGFEIQGKTRQTHVLQLIKNLYGQKQAGCIWNQHLHNKLIELGWKQSKADECLYYYGEVLYIIYVDDGILVSPSQEKIDKQLLNLQQHFNISVEGNLADYVGVNIEKIDQQTINITQPNIIKSILQELNFEEGKENATPASSGTIVKNGEGEEPH
jgi:Reverse transcriptase (RNA-dependent DNA polymerase)